MADGKSLFNEEVSDTIGHLYDFYNSEESPEEFLEKKQILEHILEGIEESILLLSKDYKIRWANRVFLEQTGQKIDDVLGNYCHKIIHGRDSDCGSHMDTCPLQESLQTGSPSTALHHHKNNNSHLYFENKIYPIKNSKGEPSLFVHIGRDVTEKKQIEDERDLANKMLKKAYAELKDIDRLKNDIVSNVSHELRTPITIIKASIEVIQDAESVAEEKKLLTMIETAIDRLNNVVEDFVNASDIYSGDHKLDVEKIDYVGMLKELIGESKMRSKEKNLTFSISIPESLPFVKGDKRAVKKILRNVLINAIKFNKENGRISVVAKEDGPMIQTTITDSGVGIPEEEVGRIFSPLYQLDPTSSRSFEGTGMGLTVAKSLIDSHGGAIWVESKAGKGTSVHFTLPLA